MEDVERIAAREEVEVKTRKDDESNSVVSSYSKIHSRVEEHFNVGNCYGMYFFGNLPIVLDYSLNKELVISLMLA